MESQSTLGLVTGISSSLAYVGTNASQISIVSRNSLSTTATTNSFASESPSKRRKTYENLDNDLTNVKRRLFAKEIEELEGKEGKKDFPNVETVENPFEGAPSSFSTNSCYKKEPRLLKRSEVLEKGGNISNTSDITGTGIMSSNTGESSVSTLRTIAKRVDKSNSLSRLSKSTSLGCTIQKDSLKPIILAHDRNVQELMDGYQIARGVQYEIARGVTQEWWEWSDVTDNVLKQLRGLNADVANRVSTVIGKGERKFSAGTLAARREILQVLSFLC